MYPIKLDHKWGFMNISGRVVTPPTYDRIGKELPYQRNRNVRFAARSNMFTVELEGKLGLVGRDGLEVLAPKYYDIALINDSTFMVKETPDAENPSIINTKGEILVKGKFDDIILIKDNYYKVAKRGLWGVQKGGETMTIPPKYKQLKPQDKGKGYVTFSTEKKWGLMDLDGQQILAEEFNHIKVLNDTFFITKTKQKVEFWDAQQHSFLDTNYVDFQIIHPSLIQLETKNKLQTLYSVTEKKILMPPGQYKNFRPVPGTDYIYITAHQKTGLMDKTGRVIVAPKFAQMNHLKGELFRIGVYRNHGIFSISEGITLPKGYGLISSFTGNIALVRKMGYWGAINEKGKLIIPTEYALLKQDGNYVKAFKKNQESLTYATVDTYSPEMDLYQLNEAGEVINEEDFSDVYTLRVGYKLGIQDYPDGAASLGNLLPASSGNMASSSTEISRRDPEIQANSSFQWYLDEETKLWGLKHRFQEYIIKKPAYTFVRHIPYSDLTVVASAYKKDLIDSPLDTLLDNFNDSLGIQGLALFSHDFGDFITDFKYNGIRINKSVAHHDVITFINKEGLFGLMNTEGTTLKKAKKNQKWFNYIGKFNDGLAPACIGGERLKECEGDSCFAPISTDKLVQQFYIQRDMLNTNTGADFSINEAKWGFINPEGEWVIQPKYEYVEIFKNDVALCKKGDFWGMINEQEQELLAFEYTKISRFPGNRYKLTKTNYQPVYFDYNGKMLMDRKYAKFEHFSDGLCAVQRRDSLWGFIDKNGQEVLPCQYESARPFGQGRAAVKEHGTWGFINKKGEKIWTLPKGVQNVGTYRHGKVWFKNKKGLYGFYNWDGKVFIRPKYSVAFDFQQGRARAAFKAKTGLIDTTGHYVLNPKRYDLIWEFDENGLAQAYEENDGLVGLINREGQVIVDMKYRLIETFKNGYAKVLSYNGYGYINTAGEEVIPAIYESIGEVSEGLVAVSPYNEYEWTYLNLKQERVINDKFMVANPFVNGYAIVGKMNEGSFQLLQIDKTGTIINNLEAAAGEVLHQSEGLIGIKIGKTEDNPNAKEYCYFINTKGQKLFNREFAKIGPFKNGLALVQLKNKRWSLINHFGHFVMEPKFHKMEEIDADLLLAFSRDLFGISDVEGNILLAPQYDRLTRFGQLFRVEKDDAVGYLDVEGNWVWEMNR